MKYKKFYFLQSIITFLEHLYINLKYSDTLIVLKIQKKNIILKIIKNLIKLILEKVKN